MPAIDTFLRRWPWSRRIRSLVLLSCFLVLTNGLFACASLGSASGSGAGLFRRARCVDCHGEQGQGSANGPALVKIGEHWSLTELIEFIADPEPFRERDERLDALSIRFNSRMTPFDTLPASDRRAIAKYLLAEHN